LNQEAGMNTYSGIDLHSNNCVVAVSDEADRVCCERRVPNDLAHKLARACYYMLKQQCAFDE
jgi:hypothetical protein